MPGRLSSSVYCVDTWGINGGYPIHQWWRNEYFYFTVSFIADGETVLSERQVYNTEITAPTAPNKPGYTFIGWYSAQDGGSKVLDANAGLIAGVSGGTDTITLSTTSNKPYAEGSVAYFARYSANTNTAYTVNHYYMDATGSYDVAPVSEGKTGTTDTAAVYADLISVPEHFTYDAETTGGTSANIDGTGDVVINLYYARDQYTVTFVSGATGATLDTQTVYYEADATAPDAPAYVQKDADDHYKFTGWDGDFTNISGDLTVTALYETEAHDAFGAYTNGGDTHSRTCANCNYVDSGEHVWKWVTDTEPGCGTAGVKHQECENCDAVQNENTAIDPTGEHVWKWVTDTEPGCGTPGVQHQECENCDAVQNENTPIEATGEHVWKWVTDTEPGCGTPGVQHQECENCDAVQNENTPIEATGEHVWKPRRQRCR